VTQAISTVPGVISQEVNLTKDDVVVRYDRRRTSPTTISSAISRAGYHPHPAR
jgi:copper chaperone CopZ